MGWKGTTLALLATMMTSTLVDFLRVPTHPHRWALWLPPLVYLGWVSYLQWKDWKEQKTHGS
jgi:hypothetical protein